MLWLFRSEERKTRVDLISCLVKHSIQGRRLVKHENKLGCLGHEIWRDVYMATDPRNLYCPLSVDEGAGSGPGGVGGGGGGREHQPKHQLLSLLI